MHPQQIALILLNVAGGAAVLASYAWGMAHPDAGARLWGGVPETWKPLYTLSMALAALGYFPFTILIGFRLDPARVRIARQFGFGVFLALYTSVLVPSALWLPLTFAMIASPGAILWLAIRVVLFAVAGGSVGILVALLRLSPRPRGWLFPLALAGCAAFCVQTALLDAFVWPAYW